MTKCKDCWWFKQNPLQKHKKGQCLVYGFAIDGESTICCDYERGERSG